jgi:FkbM family methyltransferase
MLKSIIQKSPFYAPARSAYRAVFKSDQILDAVRMGAFYAQFFEPDDIVFDVGANQGEYAECFAKEGATVIAIEPNEAHQARLAALGRSLPVRIERVAVSDAPGVSTLNICSTSGYSTLAPANSDWMAASPDYAEVQWVGQAEVRTVTLDQLAEKCGQPTFVKIDIEGYELAALKGMSFKPRYLSFEYGVRRKEIALDCLDLLGSRGYRFRPIDGRRFRFSAADWMPAANAKAWLEGRTLADGEYGDMFAYRWPE